MKEDLGLYANQLTLMGTLFTAGGLVFQIPSSNSDTQFPQRRLMRSLADLLITRIPPRLWLPGCEFVWGLCTLLLVSCMFLVSQTHISPVVCASVPCDEREADLRPQIRHRYARGILLCRGQSSPLVKFRQVPDTTLGKMHWIFGSWYTRKEIGKRAALFAMCAYAGSMFSGFIQSGVQKVSYIDNLSG